jgi:hypothetical protein
MLQMVRNDSKVNTYQCDAQMVDFADDPRMHAFFSPATAAAKHFLSPPVDECAVSQIAAFKLQVIA